MQTESKNEASNLPAKPISEFQRPELVRLPELTTHRLRIRNLLNRLVRLLVRLFLRPSIQGLENFPAEGPLLVVANHLGDADDLLKVAIFPRQIEAIAKIELYNIPVLGKLMDAYGVIWIRRGQPDRRALRAALEGLAQGRVVMINPEGRESVSGAMEEATGGAAYLSHKSGAPILPIAITGTQNSIIYPNLVRLRRSQVTITIGLPFYLATGESLKDAIQLGTEQIMQSLASMLPIEYRGVYQINHPCPDR